MENSAALWARTFRNIAKASAAASKAGPRLAEVAGSTSSRALAARFCFGGFHSLGLLRGPELCIRGRARLPAVPNRGVRRPALAAVASRGTKICGRRNRAQRLKPPPVATLIRTAEAVLFHRESLRTTAFSDQLCSAYSNTFTTALALASSTMGARCRGDRIAAASSSCSVPANRSPR